MKRFRAVATARQIPTAPVSARALAQMVNMPPPVSVTQLIAALLAPVTFHADITTPAGTALGGTVDLTLFSDGRYSFNVHMHDSGFDPYTFRVRCALQAPSGLILLFQASGHTDGSGSNLLGHVNRDFDHHENGQKAEIRQFWIDVRQSSLSVSKSYEDAGALHAIEDIAKDLLGFLVADVTLGAGLALVVCVSAELADAVDASFVGPGGLVGVVVAGGVVWVFGPSAILAAVVAGIAAGAITDAMIRHRQMTVEEYQFAQAVFGDTLPPRDRLYITNLSHGGGRLYTWPNVDGSVVLNLNDAFDDPVHQVEGYPYTTRGQVFIHEMAHAWQTRTKSFVPGLLCRLALETSSYDFTPQGQAWSDFGLEQQAAVVDQWFRNNAEPWNTVEDLTKNLSNAKAMSDPLFVYIANNIRLGQN